MTREQMNNLVEQYFNKEGYEFPTHQFEHRLESTSSSMIYSMLRELEPTLCLHIGTWNGGSTAVSLAAMEKNKKPYLYITSELLEDKRAQTVYNVFQHVHTAPFMLGDITKQLPVLERLGKLDYLFVDTDHDLETTEWIFKNVVPMLRSGGLYVMHDWPVEEKKGKWISKDDSWEETDYIIKLHESGKLPLSPLYWTWNNPGQEETGFFTKI